MAAGPVPERVRWALEILAPAPDDRVLEIGCGRGSLVAALCPRLTGGRVLAIDRSVTMIKIAEQRNAAHVTSGRASFRNVAFDALDPAPAAFDTIAALNVNFFWVRPAAPDLRQARQALRPGGGLYLMYELPGVTRAAAIEDRLHRALREQDFTTSAVSGRTSGGNALLAVVARPG